MKLCLLWAFGGPVFSTLLSVPLLDTCSQAEEKAGAPQLGIVVSELGDSMLLTGVLN